MYIDNLIHWYFKLRFSTLFCSEKTFQCSFWTTMKYLKHSYISMERLWNGLFGKNYFVYAWSNRKPNEAGQLERDNISLSELIACKTSGQLPSWWVGIQNHVGIFRYSYWMFCNLSVKFAVQNFTNTLNIAGHCGDTFLQFFLGWYLGSLWTKF